MTTIEQALVYLELGWSVIPIQPKLKKPTGKWEEYQTRRMTSDEARLKFHEGDNLALVCGDISEVLVIDLDDYKKQTMITIDSPLKVITPRGGVHGYFRYSEGTRNTVNTELATDIRSKGGYVLVPESYVDMDGYKGGYAWNVEPTRELLDSLAEAPVEMLQAVYGVMPGAVKTPFQPASAFNLTEGSRNDQIHRLALSLLAKHDEATAKLMVFAANQTATPPLGQKELETIWASAIRFFRISPPQRQQQNIRQPKTVIENEAYRRTSTNEDFDRVVQSFIDGKQRGISTGFPELDRITGGLMPGQSYLLFADTNVGKSVLAVNIVVDLAARGYRTVYFDLENSMDMSMERMMFAANKGAVLLHDWRVAVEDKDEKYMRQCMEALRPLLPNLYVWDLNKLNDRFGEILWEGVKKCIDEAIDSKAQVVVIDHLHYFSPSETDYAVLGEVSRHLNNLAAIHNIAVILVAHTRKGLLSSDKKGKVEALRPTIDFINGSSLIAKHFKNIIALRRNVASEEPLERCETFVYVDKTKFGPSGSFQLRYNEDTLCFQDPKQDHPHNADFAQRDVERQVALDTLTGEISF